MYGFLNFLVVFSALACLKAGPCLASPINARGDAPALQQPDDLSEHERARRSPQFSIKTKSRLGLGLGAFFDKHRETQSSIGDLATANKKAGLLEKTSQLSTREQKNTAVRKLGDQESHSVSSVKTLDEKHSTAMADGLGGQSQNVSALSTTDEQLASSQFSGGVGKHAVSSKQTEDEQHSASSVSGAGEETHITSSSNAADEKHSVFTSGLDGVIPLRSNGVDGGSFGGSQVAETVSVGSGGSAQASRPQSKDGGSDGNVAVIIPYANGAINGSPQMIVSKSDDGGDSSSLIKATIPLVNGGSSFGAPQVSEPVSTVSGSFGAPQVAELISTVGGSISAPQVSEPVSDGGPAGSAQPSGNGSGAQGNIAVVIPYFNGAVSGPSQVLISKSDDGGASSRIIKTTIPSHRDGSESVIHRIEPAAGSIGAPQISEAQSGGGSSDPIKTTIPYRRGGVRQEIVPSHDDLVPTIIPSQGRGSESTIIVPSSDGGSSGPIKSTIPNFSHGSESVIMVPSSDGGSSGPIKSTIPNFSHGSETIIQTIEPSSNGGVRKQTTIPYRPEASEIVIQTNGPNQNDMVPARRRDSGTIIHTVEPSSDGGSTVQKMTTIPNHRDGSESVIHLQGAGSDGAPEVWQHSSDAGGSGTKYVSKPTSKVGHLKDASSAELHAYHHGVFGSPQVAHPETYGESGTMPAFKPASNTGNYGPPPPEPAPSAAGDRPTSKVGHLKDASSAEIFDYHHGSFGSPQVAEPESYSSSGGKHVFKPAAYKGSYGPPPPEPAPSATGDRPTSKVGHLKDASSAELHAYHHGSFGSPQVAEPESYRGSGTKHGYNPLSKVGHMKYATAAEIDDSFATPHGSEEIVSTNGPGLKRVLKPTNKMGGVGISHEPGTYFNLGSPQGSAHGSHDGSDHDSGARLPQRVEYHHGR